jgi:putative transposase
MVGVAAFPIRQIHDSETVFGSLTVEWLHGHRFVTRRQAKDEVIAWLLCYKQS